MKRTINFLLFVCAFCISPVAYGQTWIEGKVHSVNDNVPLSRTNIRVIGQHSSMSTAKDGSFRLLVPNLLDTLIITSIGYEEANVPVRYFIDQDIYYLTPSIDEIEEVIVSTGYQTLKANEITGAIDHISNEMLNKQTGVNILQRINNVTTAVRFDNQPIQNSDLQKHNISVRGLSTINGARDPLIVLDGYIYEGNIENIDPNSIESISILKDASASAIWGARAGNGVIVMTSKKGVYSSEQKLRVSLNNTLIAQDRPRIESLYQLSNHDFIEIEKMLFDSGYYDGFIQFSPFVAMTPAVDIFDRRKKGLISQQDSARAIEHLLGQDSRQNYADLFLRKPISQQYALHINGGSEKQRYGFGVGYTESVSEVDAHNKKLNLQLSNGFKLAKNIDLDISVLYTNENSLSGKPEFSALAYNGKSVPYMYFLDTQGDEVAMEREYRRLYMDQNFSDGYLDWGYFPLSDHKMSNTAVNMNEFYGNAQLRYRILEYLDFNISGQYQTQNSKQIQHHQEDSYYTRSYINRFTSINPITGDIHHPVPLGDIRASYTDRTTSYTFRSQLNANRSIGEHRIIGMIGAEIRQNQILSEESTAYGYKERPLTSVPVDYATLYFLVPNFLPATILGHPNFGRRTNRFVSLYTNWSQIWKDRYGVSVSARSDGANIFGASTNDKWSPLWSTGLSWNIHNEEFIRQESIDRLRIRVTYGKSGNVDLRRSADPIASLGYGRFTNYPSLGVSSLNDPSLRWEKVATFNVALDFSLWNGRVGGSVDYYIKNGTDLYGLTEYDYTVWGRQGTITKNVASMQGRGWDININTINIDRAITWQSRLLLSLNRNKTTDYYASTNSGVSRFIGNANAIQPIVGKPLHALAGYRWMGLDGEGRPQGVLNGETSIEYAQIRQKANEDPDGDEGVIYYGSSKPQVFGNIINSFDHRGVGVEFNISFRGDYHFLKPTTSYSPLFQRGQAYPDFESRWQKSGDENITNVPVMQYPVPSGADEFYRNAEINILRGGHVRLEYISAYYQQNVLLGGRNVSLKLYTNVSNIGLLWTSNKMGIDPEFSYRLAPPTTYSLGLKIDY